MGHPIGTTMSYMGHLMGVSMEQPMGSHTSHGKPYKVPWEGNPTGNTLRPRGVIMGFSTYLWTL